MPAAAKSDRSSKPLEAKGLCAADKRADFSSHGKLDPRENRQMGAENPLYSRLIGRPRDAILNCYIGDLWGTPSACGVYPPWRVSSRIANQAYIDDDCRTAMRHRMAAVQNAL